MIKTIKLPLKPACCKGSLLFDYDIHRAVAYLFSYFGAYLLCYLTHSAIWHIGGEAQADVYQLASAAYPAAHFGKALLVAVMLGEHLDYLQLYLLIKRAVKQLGHRAFHGF